MNEMMKEVKSIADIAETDYWRLEEKIRLLIPTQRILDLKNIFIVGSGDSYMAGLVSEMAFLKRTKLYTKSFKAMDFSRYFLPVYSPYPSKNSLVISISNSGGAARVVEAQRRAKDKLFLTLSITSNVNSQLAKESDYCIDTSIEKISSGSVPGVRSFVVAQIALYLLSIRIGELKANYTMDEAQSMRKQMYNSLKENINLYDNLIIKKFVETINDNEQVEILGSGPTYGIAEYFAATVIEAVGYNATVSEIEEFGHVNFFKNNPSKIPTVIFASKNSESFSRIKEIIESVESLTRPFIIITNEESYYLEKYPSNTVYINNNLEELGSSLIFSSSVSTIVSMLGNVENPSYFRNHSGLYDESRLIRPSESKIE